eukprot:598167-Hanusia_phi.AAC.2
MKQFFVLASLTFGLSSFFLSEEVRIATSSDFPIVYRLLGSWELPCTWPARGTKEVERFALTR